MPSFADAWRAADGIEGWLLESQASALFDAAKSINPATSAVEIGSHRGKSAAIIASALPSGARLTAVDPFDDPRWGGGPDSLERFEANMTAVGVRERIDLFRGLSADASSQWSGPPVGFLWVDGAHDVASTLADLDGWLPHMAPGGLIYVHDAFSAVGTTLAVLRRGLFSRHLKYIGCVRTLVKFRVEPVSLSGRVASSFGLLRRLPFFIRVVAIKLARRRGFHGLEARLMRQANEPLI